MLCRRALFLALLAISPWSCTALWPIPSQYSHGDAVLFIQPAVQISLAHANQSASSLTSGGIIATAIDGLRTTLFNQSYYPWQLRKRNTDFDPTHAAGRSISSIQLIQLGEALADEFRAEAGELDESYTLSLDAHGQVKITANSSIGLSYGLTTFSQLFFKTRDGLVYTNLAPVDISDRPMFPHRGLNLDVARSYYSPAAIYRQIDGLAYNKMNRLHIHITDSQSWPLEVPALPLLADRGRYSPGFTYSPQVLSQIQQYGALRGVQVYLEIDMPGHIGIVALSYPDLIVAWNIQPDWDVYSLEPPSGALKLKDPAVYDFLNTLFDDVLPRVSSYSAYWHAGGDEVVVEQYLLEQGLESDDMDVLRPYMQALVDRNLAQIQDNGLDPIVWEELLLSWNLTLPANTIVQCWEDSASILATVQAGYRALAGDYNNWYLDCGYGQWLDFYPNVSAEYYPYQDYCSPRKSWRQIYAFDPLTDIPSDLTHLVLGGEVHMWSEQTDEVSADSKIWPRAAAAAEVLWSGAKDAAGNNRSQVEASPRLTDMRERLVAKGIAAEIVHMAFCTQNGTQCAL